MFFLKFILVGNYIQELSPDSFFNLKKLFMSLNFKPFRQRNNAVR